MRFQKIMLHCRRLQEEEIPIGMEYQLSPKHPSRCKQKARYAKDSTGKIKLASRFWDLPSKIPKSRNAAKRPRATFVVTDGDHLHPLLANQLRTSSTLTPARAATGR